jgi:predicted DNA-binding transcriptional regulator YafY
MEAWMAGNAYPAAVRLFELARHLDAGGVVSVDLIRARYGTARSTAEDYLEFLRDQRPLVPTAEGDGFMLRERPGAPRVEHPLDEALAVTFGRVALSSLAGTRVHQSLVALAGPIQSGVSEADFHTLSRVGQAYQRLAKPEAPPRRASTLDALIEGLHTLRRCRLVYRDLAGRETQREVEPWSIFENKDVVYLFANTLPGRQPRTFDVDGIAQAQVLDVSFRPPVPLPDPAELLSQATGIYMSAEPPQDIELLARDWPATHLVRRPLHPSQHHEAVGPDLIRVRLRVQPTPDLVVLLLSYLPHVRPLAPASFVAAFEQRRTATLPVWPA